MGIKSTQTNMKMVAKLMSGRTGKMKPYVAILLVSIGKENFEGEALESAIQMINQEFGACCIVLADTLQRYNIATDKDISPDEAYQESFNKGSEWLDRYQVYFKENLNIPYEIIRWDTLLAHENFQCKEALFLNEFEHSPLLQNAMLHSIDEYGKRVQKRMGAMQFEQEKGVHEQNCYAYLKEECVAITLFPEVIGLVRESTAATIVYPGRPTEILQANRDVLLTKEFADLFKQHSDYLNWLPYRFNKTAQSSLGPSKQSETKVNEDTSYEKKVFEKRLDFANQILESQLVSIQGFLNNDERIYFNKIVLDGLLKKVEKTLLTEGDKVLSAAQLSKVFLTQLSSFFDTVEHSLVNQCKANIVRILKRENAALSGRVNQGSLTLSLPDQLEVLSR